MTLKEMRMRKELTQAQVADQAGLSRAAYCMYESGQRMPSIKSARIISEILGVTWVEVIEGCERGENDAGQ